MAKILIPILSGKAENYVNALEACGAEVAVVNEITAIDDYDGLLLPGGADIDPGLYDEENTDSRNIDERLDQLQMHYFHFFLNVGKPILGVCRGHQLINVALGGSLHQDLYTDIDDALIHHDPTWMRDPAHEIHAEKGSFLEEMYGKSFTVNSSHHQAVREVGKGLKVVAVSSDGIIEAMSSEEQKIWTVQFHPERMCLAKRREDTVDGLEIFRMFVRHAEM